MKIRGLVVTLQQIFLNRFLCRDTSFIDRLVELFLERRAVIYVRGGPYFEPNRSPRKMMLRFIKDASKAGGDGQVRSNLKKEERKKMGKKNSRRERKKEHDVQLWNSNKVLNKCRGRFRGWKNGRKEVSLPKPLQVSSLCSNLYRAKTAR